MRKIFLSLLTSMVLIFITLVSCEKSSDNETEMATINKNVIDNTHDIRDRDSTRISNQDSSDIKSCSINPDDYQIIFRDSYGDYFYLNLLPNAYSTSTGYYAYKGSFVHSGITYETAVIYYKNTKTLAASLFYINDQCMVYNAKWVSNNYFTGTYTWVKADHDYLYKQKNIACTFTKGAFPGMNDTKK